MFWHRLGCVVTFLTMSASLCAARDLAVVSNKANTIGGLTQSDLVKLSKGEMSRWPDGKPATLIMRPPSTPEMKALVEKIYEVPSAQVSEIISTANHGRANHPAIIIATSDEDLVNKVAALPGAVGIVDVYAINSSVTVIKVGGKLPLEPGYLLHGN